MNEAIFKSPDEFDCLQRFLTETADKNGSRLFMTFPDDNIRLSYHETQELWERGAAFLQSEGISHGERIIVSLNNCPEYIVVLGAAFLAGAVPVLTNPGTGPDRLHELAVLSGAASVISRKPIEGFQYFDPGNFSPLTITKTKSGYAKVISRKEELAYIIFTSGTTGLMKGIQITNKNVLLELGSLIRAHKLTKDDTHLCILPLYHAAALFRNFLMPFSLGAETIVAKEFDASAFWNLIETHQVAFTQVVPTILASLVETPYTNASKYLNYICTTSAPCPSELIRGFERKFGVLVIEAYGLTETTSGATLNPPNRLERRIGSVGVSSDIAIVDILDKNGNLLPPGLEGEVRISGPQISPGYIRPEEEGALKNGHVFTGDIGYKDEDGFVYIVGRKSDLIYRGGNKISPTEIEEELIKHPNIQFAVAFGVTHRSLGEDIIAYIKPVDKSLFVEKEVRIFLSKRLIRYMIPTRIFSVPDLFSGLKFKIQRDAFKKHYLESKRLHVHETPSTVFQKQLAVFWQEVLDVEDIGIHDNFFEFGGDSIKARILINTIQTNLRMFIPVTAVFYAPTIAELSDYLNENHTGKADELSRKIPEYHGTMTWESDIESSDQIDSGGMRLSFAQQRLWFLHQMAPDSPAYNIPMVMRLTGSLNVESLRKSLGEIILRHETLRTVFDTMEGQPVQVVMPATLQPLPLVNMKELTAQDRDAEVLRISCDKAHQVFDLSKGPLLSATLLKLDEKEHVLIVVVHHIVFDGWSIGIFIRELLSFYKLYSLGETLMFPGLQVQYTGYTRWQRRLMQGDFLETQLTYWKKQLSGIPSVLNIHTNRPRPRIQTYNGNNEYFQIDLKVTKVLKELCRQSETTLFMALISAYAILLSRYTNQKDIVIGTPFANRNRKEIESLIGLFVNTLPMRFDLSGNPFYLDLLNNIRQMVLNAHAHQDIPFEILVEALELERNLSYSPLFQVMFILQNAPLPVSELPGLTVNSLAIRTGTAKFDLTLSIEESEKGLACNLEYNTDLFDRDTITRMARHFQTLLKGVADNPEQRISELPLLTEAERYQMLLKWNDTDADYQIDMCIHKLFEAQAERTPDSVALISGNEQVTYGELNKRANRMAHYLRSSGTGPETLIGICLERSVEMMVGLLGVLKAGGAYVPLDPAFPETRLAFMLEDAQVSVLITQKKLAEKLPVHETHVLFLDTDWDMIAEESEDNTGRWVVGDNLAYVIYTSGSTGKPKGVQIPHSALSNFLLSMQQCPGLVKQDVLLAVTTLSFDIAALELFLPLIVGARVVLADHETVIDGVKLADQITKHGVTVMQATPATWRLLVESEWKGKKTLKALCGGEALPVGLARQLTSHVGFLWNMYGPTETTIWSGVCKVEAEDSLTPIGLPIANTRFYVLDAYLNPVPIGVPGELYIGGSGLARGYLNRPELTSEKFVTNPFSREPEKKRLYRTGDLVRYLPDGNIEFLGRIDYQVKVRGFRIELGEIEAALTEHPAVTECVVIDREDRPGDKYLTAYLVPDQENGPSASELHRFVKEKLPDYMIPSAFVEMKALPLTPNGKTDRHALPVPNTCRPELDAAYVMPQSEVERFIANVWQEMLVVDKVGIHDNFFELGGHSLLTVQIHHKLQKEFEKKLSVIDMFQYPTIHSLAQYIQSEKDERFPSRSGRRRAETRTNREVLMRRQRQLRQKKKHQMRDKKG